MCSTRASAAILGGYLLLAELIAAVWPNHQRTTAEWLAVPGAAAVTFLGIVLLGFAYDAAATVLFDFRESCPPAGRPRLTVHTERMFGRKTQGAYALTSAALGTALVILLQPRVAWCHYLMVVFVAVPFFAVTGYGLGLAITSMRWVRSLEAGKDITLRLIPSQTPLIRDASALTGKFALYFAIQSTCEITLFLLIPWARPFVFNVVSSMVMYPVIAIAGLFFVVPQFSLRRLIVSGKTTTLSELQHEIEAHAARGDWASLAPVVTVHEAIQKSPSFVVDPSTSLRFVSLAVPMFATGSGGTWHQTVSQVLPTLLK